MLLEPHVDALVVTANGLLHSAVSAVEDAEIALIAVMEFPTAVIAVEEVTTALRAVLLAMIAVIAVEEAATAAIAV